MLGVLPDVELPRPADVLEVPRELLGGESVRRDGLGVRTVGTLRELGLGRLGSIRGADGGEGCGRGERKEGRAFVGLPFEAWDGAREGPGKERGDVRGVVMRGVETILTRPSDSAAESRKSRLKVLRMSEKVRPMTPLLPRRSSTPPSTVMELGKLQPVVLP